MRRFGREPGNFRPPRSSPFLRRHCNDGPGQDGIRLAADGLAAVLSRLCRFGTHAIARTGQYNAPKGRVHWIEIPRQRGFEALREALVNAVAHRDYAITGSKILLEVFSGRVDVTSPGGLPNHVSVESVRAGAHPRSRNELLANYMMVKGFMEQRGRGWPVMRRAMREFNGTEPDIVAEPTHVRVTFRLDPACAGSAFQASA